MKFRFDVNFTEEDYFEFNKFQMLSSKTGKKGMRTTRIIISAFTLFIILMMVIFNLIYYYPYIPWLPIIMVLVLFTIYQLTLKASYISTLKRRLKKMKKDGKLLYSPEAVLEFYDDYFIEITETQKTENKYESIESVCIIKDKAVYIFINSILAYVLPISAFNSAELHNDFIKFLNTKTTNIEYHNQ